MGDGTRLVLNDYNRSPGLTQVYIYKPNTWSQLGVAINEEAIYDFTTFSVLGKNNFGQFIHFIKMFRLASRLYYVEVITTAVKATKKLNLE